MPLPRRAQMSVECSWRPPKPLLESITANLQRNTVSKWSHVTVHVVGRRGEMGQAAPNPDQRDMCERVHQRSHRATGSVFRLHIVNVVLTLFRIGAMSVRPVADDGDGDGDYSEWPKIEMEVMANRLCMIPTLSFSCNVLLCCFLIVLLCRCVGCYST